MSKGRRINPLPVTSFDELLYFMGKGRTLFRHRGIWLLALRNKILLTPEHMVNEVLGTPFYTLKGVVVHATEKRVKEATHG